MIIVSRLYLVLSVLALVLITIFYLLYLQRYSKENILYIQGNSRYALPVSSSFKDINVYNTNTLTYNINISRIYLDNYSGSTKSGRFILHFSQIGNINLRVIDDQSNVVSTFKSQSLRVNYPIYVDFYNKHNSEYLDLQYTTDVQNVILYKLSVEFF